MARAIFGRPVSQPVPGGAQVAVYLVPVTGSGVVAFDVAAGEIRGRFLPWAVIDHGQNPYEAASLLADDWLNMPLDRLSIADVLSLPAEGGGWELAIVFRADLSGTPRGDAARRPVALDPADIERLGRFAGREIQRWASHAPAAPAASQRLVF